MEARKMATERMIEREVPVNERVYVDNGGGSGAMGVLIGIAALALVAIIAFFVLGARQNDAIRTNAVTSAAATVADSTANAAQDVGNAANNAAEAVNPK